MDRSCLTLLLLGMGLPLSALAEAKPIPLQTYSAPAVAPGKTVTEPLLVGEIPGVDSDRLLLIGPVRYEEPASTNRDVVFLFLDGKATLVAKGQEFPIDDETIARVPMGWGSTIQVPHGERLHLVRIRKPLNADDQSELKKFPENNAAPYVKRFRDCTPYGEAIKSAKTVSRTLLPANYVPRVAIGTVETTGPDAVGAHRHPMLEQLFLGLKNNDVTVTADDAQSPLPEYAILHIPLGSNHGVQVTDGKKLYYMWMDFFATTEGQAWLQTHKPSQDSKEKKEK